MNSIKEKNENIIRNVETELLNMSIAHTYGENKKTHTHASAHTHTHMHILYVSNVSYIMPT